MRRIICLLILSLLPFSGGIGQINPPDTILTASVGGTDWDYCKDMCMIEDAYLVQVGSTESFTSPWTQVYVVKMDTLGNPIWDLAFGGPMDDRGNGICPAHDGGVMVTGSFGNGWKQLYLVKISSSGSIVWESIYTNVVGRSQYGQSIYPIRDEGYIIGANSNYFGGGNYDAWLIKVNSQGDTISSVVIGGGDDDFLNSIIQTSDDGFAFTGFRREIGGYWQPWVVKTDSLGNVLWNRTYDTPTTGVAYDIIEASDSSLVFTGYTGYAQHRFIFLTKIDSSGDYIWNRTYDYPDWLYIEQIGESVAETKDGGFVIGGYCRYWDRGGMLLKTNAEGDSLWTAYLERTNDKYQFNKVIQSESGKYYAGGIIHYQEDFFLAAYANDMPEMSITPIGAPIRIPAAGGLLSYEFNITNTTENTFTFNIWNGVECASGRYFEPFAMRVNLSLAPGESYNRIHRQRVPGFAPPGIYTYYVRIGDFPLQYYTRDSFQFVKNPGEVDDKRSSVEFTVDGHSLKFSLDKADNVRIGVYDILGREVAELYDNYCAPGSYELNMNLPSLPSGIYFLRMQTSNKQQIIKVALLK